MTEATLTRSVPDVLAPGRLFIGGEWQDAASGRTFEVIDPAPAVAGWRDLEPDGRIPVYFVPHMENHYPLALGMISTALAAHDASQQKAE